MRLLTLVLSTAFFSAGAHASYVANNPVNLVDPTGECGADHENKEVCVFGIPGAGPASNSNNTELKNLVDQFGGITADIGAGATADSIREFKEANPDGKVVIIGVSRGGNEAVQVANDLAGNDNTASVNVDSLVTFDPHRFVGSSFKVGDNVKSGVNFFQRNPRTRFGGFNPFRGRPVNGANVTNHNLTGQPSPVQGGRFVHNSIVRDVQADRGSALSPFLPRQ